MRLRSIAQPWLWTPIVVLIDFVSKRLVLANIDTLRARVELLGDFVRFTYVRNPGAAMGLFHIGRGYLITVSILAVFFLSYLYFKSDRTQVIRRSALAAIIGGAFGNLIDRIFYSGNVVDFIDIGIGTSRFYTFNVADIGVTIGGAILFLCILRETRHEPQSPESAPAMVPEDD